MTPETLREHKIRKNNGGEACRIFQKNTGQWAFVSRVLDNGSAVCADLSGEHGYLGFLLTPAESASWSLHEGKNPPQRLAATT